jgi:hypothetical protein
MDESMTQFEKLTEAFWLFNKYVTDQRKWYISCDHDVMYVHVEYESVSPADRSRLEELGFIHDEENDQFLSFEHGSA